MNISVQWIICTFDYYWINNVPAGLGSTLHDIRLYIAPNCKFMNTPTCHLNREKQMGLNVSFDTVSQQSFKTHLSFLDQPVAETSTWQHTTLTIDIHALGGIRTHNPCRRAAADPRLRQREHLVRPNVMLGHIQTFQVWRLVHHVRKLS